MRSTKTTIGILGCLFLLSGCPGREGAPFQGQPAATPTRVESGKASWSPRPQAKGAPNPQSRPKPVRSAPRTVDYQAPDLMERDDYLGKLQEQIERAAPKAEDLKTLGRPFEGEQAVRQALQRPLKEGTDPETIRMADSALTFDPAEPEPVTDLRLITIAQGLLESDSFEALDAISDTLRQKRLLAQDGNLLLEKFYQGLTQSGFSEPKDSVARGERWLKSHPDSPTARYYLGSALAQWAWEARGTGWSDTVTKEGRKLFRERLQRAQKLYPGASAAKDPLVCSLLITLAKGLGSPTAETRTFLDTAMEVEPYHAVSAYESYADYILPRWYGSPEEYQAFVDDAVSRTRSELGDGLYAVLMQQTDGIKVDQERRLKGFQDLLARNPSSFRYFSECATLTLALQGPDATRALYQRVFDETLKLPLTEGDRLRLKFKVEKSLGSATSSDPPADPDSSQGTPSMMGASLGMERAEVEAMLGPPVREGQSGPRNTELSYRGGGAFYSIIVNDETQKVWRMAGPTVEVSGQTFNHGIAYSELEAKLGPPEVVSELPQGGPKTFILYYPKYDLSVTWNAKSQRIDYFRLSEDIRKEAGTIRPVTLEEWKQSWTSP